MLCESISSGSVIASQFTFYLGKAGLDWRVPPKLSSSSHRPVTCEKIRRVFFLLSLFVFVLWIRKIFFLKRWRHAYESKTLSTLTGKVNSCLTTSDLTSPGLNNLPVDYLREVALHVIPNAYKSENKGVHAWFAAAALLSFILLSCRWFHSMKASCVLPTWF
jgi:hypothetical protein